MRSQKLHASNIDPAIASIGWFILGRLFYQIEFIYGFSRRHCIRDVCHRNEIAVSKYRR
jgi:hypothetical protein